MVLYERLLISIPHFSRDPWEIRSTVGLSQSEKSPLGNAHKDYMYIIVYMQRLVLDETSKESDSSGNTILITTGLPQWAKYVLVGVNTSFNF